MIDFKEIQGGETWELFSRDFLEANGFYIETSVDRGPDGKKDLIVSEVLKGNVGNYKFMWLVSCKHFAISNNSVREEDEINLIERMRDFNCQGFIGFYSTLASSGLNTRLLHLKERKEIQDYRIFDHKWIENTLISIGYSDLLMRYFPQSYVNIKPLHKVLTEYVPLQCEYCKKDILIEMYQKTYTGLIASVLDIKSKPGVRIVKDVYCACKGKCDAMLQNIHRGNGHTTNWEDIGDLAIPTMFIRYMMSTMNQLVSPEWEYEKAALDKEKNYLIAISQKVMREQTEEERKRVLELFRTPFY